MLQSWLQIYSQRESSVGQKSTISCKTRVLWNGGTSKFPASYFWQENGTMGAERKRGSKHGRTAWCQEGVQLSACNFFITMLEKEVVKRSKPNKK